MFYTSPSPNVWGAYSTTDLKLNGKVWDIYTDRVCDDPLPPARDFMPIDDQDKGGVANAEGVAYNREHTFPKSWFNSPATPVAYEGTDVMFILPVDKFVNSPRINSPYGVVGVPTQTFTNGSKIGTSAYPGFEGTVFEPIDEYKGDIARIYFYMATRYENKIDGWNFQNSTDVLALNKYPVFNDWFLKMLLDWNHNDPVSQKEIERNQAVYNYQGNRNPFVDHPEWVDAVWGATCNAASTQASGLSATATTESSTTLQWSSKGSGDHVIVLGKLDAAVDACPVSGTSYTANTIFGAGSQIGVGSFVVYEGNASNASISSLVGGANYHFAIFAANGTCYRVTDRLVGDVKTLVKTEASEHVTNFKATETTGSSIKLSWTEGAGKQTADGYLILGSSISLASISNPIDGQSIPISIYAKTVLKGTQFVFFEGLNPNTNHYFKIYPFTNSCDQINYKLDGQIPTAEAITTKGIDISTAKSKPLGSLVTVTGIVTAGTEMGSKTRFIQDATGGLAIYSVTGALDGKLVIGDEVSITGKLKSYNYLLELDPIVAYKVNSTANPLPVALNISPDQFNSTNQGKLVRIDYVKFMDAGSFAQNTNYSFKAKNKTAVMRISSSQIGNAIPSKTVSLVGVLNQNSTSDQNSGFEVWPRTSDDFIAASLASLSTDAAKDISTTSATLSGAISNDGLAEVSLRGVCWSTSASPLINDNLLSLGSGIGSFSGSATGLNPNTTYHARAFAVNDIGVAYGSEIVFTTKKQDQTITFLPLQTKKVGDANFDLNAVSSSGLSISYTSSNLNVATVNGKTVSIIGAGITNITASQSGNSTFNPAADVVQTLTISPINAVNEIEDHSFKIYPNPSNGQFELEVENEGKLVEYSISDLTGRTIAEGQFSNNRFKIDISQQKSGVYFIQLKIGAKNLKNKLLVL